MKPAIVILLVIGVGIVFAASRVEDSSTTQANQSGPQSTSIAEIESQVASGSARLIDVRSQIEYDLGHASPAELFNVEWLKAGQRPDVSKEETLYVYCRSGNRSAQATEILRAEGYKVVDLGAFSNWTQAGGQSDVTDLLPYKQQLADLGVSEIEPLGNPDAPVTMVKFADFVCPFCARYAQETEPIIIKDYVETGKVKYEYRNVAYLGDESALAAVGGYCANEQSAFWPFHDAVIDAYTLNGDSAYSLDSMTATASDIGINSEDFYTCVESGKYDSVVSAETLEAQEQGFSSTPLFLVNNKTINGAVPLSVFTSTINSEL